MTYTATTSYTTYRVYSTSFNNLADLVDFVYTFEAFTYDHPEFKRLLNTHKEEFLEIFEYYKAICVIYLQTAIEDALERGRTPISDPIVHVEYGCMRVTAAPY